GPLFTFAAWLGALTEMGIFGAPIALAAIFLPGFMLLLGALPFWFALQAHAGVRRILQGVNASVVGILGATFYTPVLTGAVQAPLDLALALALLAALMQWRVQAWMVVLAGASGGALMGWLG